MSATVRDLMTSPVVTVTPATGFKQLSRLLQDNGFSAVPVVDLEGRMIGIVSEGDLLLKLERYRGPAAPVRSWRQRGERLKAAGSLALQLMSRPVVTVVPDASPAEAARLMHVNGLQPLPVVDGSGQLVGIVSRGDLLRAFLRTDDEIRQDVLGELAASGIATNAVKIAVQGGVVTIGCDPADEASEGQAHEVAGRVDGVVAVRTSRGRAHCMEVRR